MQKNSHTFMICAYQENPFLEQCIRSILEQTILDKVKISTSTPNNYIKNLAEKYHLELVINSGPDSAVDNWNFAYTQADTRFVTLCHQDDYYLPNYLQTILAQVGRSKQPIILFTDYCEDRMGELLETNRVLRIKSMMNFLLQFRLMWGSRFLRRRILSIGCSICCPSVTFCKDAIPDAPFHRGYENSMDWQAWERFSKMSGEFIYCNKKLMAHRIWSESITSKSIEGDIRLKEDFEILCKFWPKPIAKKILKIYSCAEKSNKLG